MKERKTYRYRSAIWGHFVSAAYAKKHPRTTVRETVTYRFSVSRGFEEVKTAK